VSRKNSSRRLGHWCPPEFLGLHNAHDPTLLAENGRWRDRLLAFRKPDPARSGASTHRAATI